MFLSPLNLARAANHEASGESLYIDRRNALVVMGYQDHQ